MHGENLKFSAPNWPSTLTRVPIIVIQLFVAVFVLSDSYEN